MSGSQRLGPISRTPLPRLRDRRRPQTVGEAPIPEVSEPEQHDEDSASNNLASSSLAEVAAQDAASASSRLRKRKKSFFSFGSESSGGRKRRRFQEEKQDDMLDTIRIKWGVLTKDVPSANGGELSPGRKNGQGCRGFANADPDKLDELVRSPDKHQWPFGAVHSIVKGPLSTKRSAADMPLLKMRAIGSKLEGDAKHNEIMVNHPQRPNEAPPPKTGDAKLGVKQHEQPAPPEPPPSLPTSVMESEEAGSKVADEDDSLALNSKPLSEKLKLKTEQPEPPTYSDEPEDVPSVSSGRPIFEKISSIGTPLNLMDLQLNPNGLQLNPNDLQFRVWKSPNKQNVREVSGREIWDFDKHRPSLEKLKELIGKSWAINFEEQRLLVNSTSLIIQQEDLDRCMRQPEINGLPPHNIMLCDLEDAKLPKEAGPAEPTQRQDLSREIAETLHESMTATASIENGEVSRTLGKVSDSGKSLVQEPLRKDEILPTDHTAPANINETATIVSSGNVSTPPPREDSAAPPKEPFPDKENADRGKSSHHPESAKTADEILCVGKLNATDTTELKQTIPSQCQPPDLGDSVKSIPAKRKEFSSSPGPPLTSEWINDKPNTDYTSGNLREKTMGEPKGQLHVTDCLIEEPQSVEANELDEEGKFAMPAKKRRKLGASRDENIRTTARELPKVLEVSQTPPSNTSEISQTALPNTLGISQTALPNIWEEDVDSLSSVPTSLAPSGVDTNSDEMGHPDLTVNDSVDAIDDRHKVPPKENGNDTSVHSESTDVVMGIASAPTASNGEVPQPAVKLPPPREAASEERVCPNTIDLGAGAPALGIPPEAPTSQTIDQGTSYSRKGPNAGEPVSELTPDSSHIQAADRETCYSGKEPSVKEPVSVPTPDMERIKQGVNILLCAAGLETTPLPGEQSTPVSNAVSFPKKRQYVAKRKSGNAKAKQLSSTARRKDSLVVKLKISPSGLAKILPRCGVKEVEDHALLACQQNTSQNSANSIAPVSAIPTGFTAINAPASLSTSDAFPSTNFPRPQPYRRPEAGEIRAAALSVKGPPLSSADALAMARKKTEKAKSTKSKSLNPKAKGTGVRNSPNPVVSAIEVGPPMVLSPAVVNPVSGADSPIARSIPRPAYSKPALKPAAEAIGISVDTKSEGISANSEQGFMQEREWAPPKSSDQPVQAKSLDSTQEAARPGISPEQSHLTNTFSGENQPAEVRSGRETASPKIPPVLPPVTSKTNSLIPHNGRRLSSTPLRQMNLPGSFDSAAERTPPAQAVRTSSFDQVKNASPLKAHAPKMCPLVPKDNFLYWDPSMGTPKSDLRNGGRKSSAVFLLDGSTFEERAKVAGQGFKQRWEASKRAEEAQLRFSSSKSVSPNLASPEAVPAAAPASAPTPLAPVAQMAPVAPMASISSLPLNTQKAASPAPVPTGIAVSTTPKIASVTPLCSSDALSSNSNGKIEISQMIFRVFRYQHSEETATIKGEDFMTGMTGTGFSYEKLKVLLQTEMKFNDLKEVLIVNGHHMVDDEEDLNAGVELYSEINEIVISRVDSMGRPPQDLAATMKKVRKMLRMKKEGEMET